MHGGLFEFAKQGTVPKGASNRGIQPRWHRFSSSDLLENYGATVIKSDRNMHYSRYVVDICRCTRVLDNNAGCCLATKSSKKEVYCRGCYTQSVCKLRNTLLQAVQTNNRRNVHPGWYTIHPTECVERHECNHGKLEWNPSQLEYPCTYLQNAR